MINSTITYVLDSERVDDLVHHRAVDLTETMVRSSIDREDVEIVPIFVWIPIDPLRSCLYLVYIDR